MQYITSNDISRSVEHTVTIISCVQNMRHLFMYVYTYKGGATSLVGQVFT